MKNRNIAIWLLDYGIVAILVALVIFFGTQSSNFLKTNTLMTILKQVSIIGVISVGMAFVILTAGIDLSVGSIACVTSVTAAMFMKSGLPTLPSCVAAVLLATLYGSVSGLLVTMLSMSPLIATLGIMTSLRGATSPAWPPLNVRASASPSSSKRRWSITISRCTRTWSSPSSAI